MKQKKIQENGVAPQIQIQFQLATGVRTRRLQELLQVLLRRRTATKNSESIFDICRIGCEQSQTVGSTASENTL